MIRYLIAALFSIIASFAIAQDRPNTILVIDGSGSMWGQIDGVNKIVIAREVVGDLLDTFPTDQNLGLTVYGHRERGSCTDIETVVAPGPETSGLIRNAVNSLNPRGKTPMTDAIIAAAEALRYTEERATVILVSDGIETCNPDPCAAARALEQAGIDFTAHVIGFDVTDPEALAQMQCLADETGGQFLTAGNADQLAIALTTVVEEPNYVPQTVQIVGVVQPGGPEITESIRWNILPEAGANYDGTGPGFAIDLVAGRYDLTGIRESDGAEANAVFDVTAQETDQGQRIEVVFPAPIPEPTMMTFRAVIGTEDGPDIETPVIWDVQSEDAGTVVDGEMANPLPAPLFQGPHSVTAYWVEQETTSRPRQFIVTADPREIVIAFDPPAVTASVGAPSSTVVGSTIEVTWDGPGAEGDFIGIGKVGAGGSAQWRNFTKTSEGSPLRLLVPPEPGPHLVAYFDGSTNEPLGSATLNVLSAEITLRAPTEVNVSETFEIAWTGPDYAEDFIGIGLVGAGGSAQWHNYTLTSEGSPLKLRAPAAPGEYLVKYFLGQENWASFEVPVTVIEPEVSLSAPDVVEASTYFEVAWSGPNTPGDFVGIGKVGAGGSAQWRNYTRTADGNPVRLQAPPEAGDYVIKYFLEQDNTALFETPITITEPQVSLTAPSEADISQAIEVVWTGPNTPGDFIGIGKVGAGGSAQWINFAETSAGNPARLMTPAEPGEYLIKYFLDQDNTPLVATPITLRQPEVSLSAPASAEVSTMIEVAWTGPNTQGDFIGVGKTGAGGSGQWRNYVETGTGNPVQLLVPAEPGDYLIKYFLEQRNTPLFAIPFRVTPASVSMDVPAVATGGTTIEIPWTGPNHAGDFIGIGLMGAGGSAQWRSYAETSDGTPARLRIPTAGGDYAVQYFLNQNNTSALSVPVAVTTPTATLNAPASAEAGAILEISWTGPNYPSDFIGIGKIGAGGSAQWRSYAETAVGPVLSLTLPDEPGDYLIQYFVNADKTAIAKRPLTIR